MVAGKRSAEHLSYCRLSERYCVLIVTWLTCQHDYPGSRHEAADQYHRFLSSAPEEDLAWYQANADDHSSIAPASTPFLILVSGFGDIARLCQDKNLGNRARSGWEGNPEYAVMKRFRKQLDLAMDHRLPVVLHIVGYQQEAYDILKAYPLRYLFHGYAGSIEAFRQFMKLDSYFTISSRILKEDKRELLLEMLKSRRFLLETDITQYYVSEGEANPLLRLEALVEEISRLFGVSESVLQRIQATNYQLLTGRDI